VSGVLNTWGKFSIPAFTPTILNLTWIIFILLLRHYFNPPIVAIAWAVFIGGILQLSFQLPYLKSLGLPILPKLDLKNSAVWRVVRLMVPAIFAMSISQISLVINTIFASFLPRGSISWMYYADRMMEFPTGVLGVALGTILLPSLSRHASNKNIVEFSKTLDWGIRLCLLLALPATVGLAIIAKPLTMTLFMHGKLFTLFDVRMTQQALVAYAVGLLGLILVKILAPGFYANQNISTPVKIAIFVLICTQLMNLAFIGPLKHAGLALSIGLGAWINAICLAYLLIKRGIYIPQTGWMAFIRKLILAISGMVVMLVLSLRLLPLDFAGHTYVRIISLLIVLTIAMTSYFAGLFMLGFRTHQFSFKTLG
ncbi:MAG: murein biosynthesis integral membrane protein MurJ, partial [Burkholderiales bacterium]